MQKKRTVVDLIKIKHGFNGGLEENFIGINSKGGGRPPGSLDAGDEIYLFILIRTKTTSFWS